MIGARNVRGGIALLSAGLLMGLLMSLYAFVPMVPKVPAALDQYDDVPRRLLRLAHVAAIMLPLINIVLGGWLDRLALSARAKEVTSRLLLWGGGGVPLGLTIEALSPLARNVHVSGVPVLVFCAGMFVATLGACRGGALSAASVRGSGFARRRAEVRTR
jgi:hypothetical protein